MELRLLEIGISIFVAAMLMILHELPKTFVYFCTTAIEGKKQPWRKIFYLKNYLDPIGLLLFSVSYAGFSKPYMFRIQSRKKNILLGITGFFTLFVIFSLSVWQLRCGYGLRELQLKDGGLGLIIGQLFWIYMAFFSGSLFLVNLFPVSVFDMGLLIAGGSARHYLGIIQNDLLIKIILMFAIAIGLIKHFSFEMVKGILAFQ